MLGASASMGVIAAYRMGLLKHLPDRPLPFFDAEASHYVGWTEAGEWLQYTIRADEAGLYTVGVEHAGPGAVSLQVNGAAVGEPVVLPATGGETNWRVTSVPGVRLEKGVNRLRVRVDRGGFNLRALTFARQ